MLHHTAYLAADEVHVWILDLDKLAKDEHLLSQDEQKRADCFMKLDDQRRYRAAHTFVRRILGRYLNASPLSLVFGASATGKPFLRAPGPPHRVAFNLSHTAQYGILAVTRDREVGVDIEIERNVEDLADMARQVMSSSEFEHFQSKGVQFARQAFFGLWTRKEALLKAIGTGLSTDPRDINIGLGTRETAINFGGTTWSVASLEVPLPLWAAVAVSGQLPVVRMLHSESFDQSKF